MQFVDAGVTKTSQRDFQDLASNAPDAFLRHPGKAKQLHTWQKKRRLEIPQEGRDGKRNFRAKS